MQKRENLDRLEFLFFAQVTPFLRKIQQKLLDYVANVEKTHIMKLKEETKCLEDIKNVIA